MDHWLYRKGFRTCLCLGLIVFAIAFRLASAPETALKLFALGKQFLSSQQVHQAVMLAELGRLPQAAAPETTTPETVEPETTAEQTAPTAIQETQAASLQTQPVEELPQEPEVAPLVFTAQEAQDIVFRGNCTYTVDAQALLSRPLNWQAGTDGPQVLVIHTHASEAYTGEDYTPSGSYRTLDDEKNVIAVGDALTQELEARDVRVIHDRSLNDYPDYNSSYTVTREKIEDYLAQYPSLVMVLDIHRDAAEEPFREAVDIAGETCAKVMLVVGTDEGGLYHPYWRENLSCALKLQALLERIAPGICRQLNLRQERFNQQETLGSLIIEVGATGNSLTEAVASAKYIAQAVAQLLGAQ